MKITIAIPCTISHFKFLDFAIEKIINGTILPDEILVSISPYSGLPGISPIIKKYENIINIKIFSSEKFLDAAQARDLMTPYINGDLVIYHNADDYQHPQRVEIVKKYFEEFDIVHLVHSYSLFDEGCCGNINKEKIISANGSTIYDRFFASKIGSLPFGAGFGKLHTGVPCIKRFILEKIKWDIPREVIRMEDYFFSVNILREFNKTLMIDAPLYIYKV